MNGLKPNDRIKLISMQDDPDPIKPGTLGTVRGVYSLGRDMGRQHWQIDVDWDNGRGLMLSVPPDRFEVV